MNIPLSTLIEWLVYNNPNAVALKASSLGVVVPQNWSASDLLAATLLQYNTKNEEEKAKFIVEIFNGVPVRTEGDFAAEIKSEMDKVAPQALVLRASLEQIQVQERVKPNSSTPTDNTTSTTDLEKKAAQKIVLAFLGILLILFSGSFIINNSFSK
jgi:hypothetical protein